MVVEARRMSLHNGAFRCAITAGPCLNSSIVSGLPIKPSWLRSLNVAERGSHFRRLTDDGLHAQEAISAGMRAMIGVEQGAEVQRRAH